LVYTSDTDWSGGTHDTTEVSGSGSSASIVLTQATGWNEHVNSDDTGEDFFDIAYASSTEAWAVAENGVIFQYDGTNWTEFVDVGGTDFNAVDTAPYDLKTDIGTIRHFNEDSGILEVRLMGMCSHCPMSQVTLKQGIEAEIRKEIPGVKEVVSV